MQSIRIRVLFIVDIHLNHLPAAAMALRTPPTPGAALLENSSVSFWGELLLLLS